MTFTPQIASVVVIIVQCYGSTKLEISMAFLFRENRRHGTEGQTNRVQHLMRSPREDYIIIM